MERHHVEVGPTTRIGDVYAIGGEHPLIALVDPHTKTVYVAELAVARVKNLLRVREAHGSSWILQHRELAGEYRVSAIEKLDLTLPLRIGMAAVNEKTFCNKTPKGDCSDMYDADDKFIYSWKASEDVFMCEWSATQDCTEILREVTIEVFAQKGCAGASKKEKKTISFCSPA